jgi:hypothetical protein
MVAQPAAGFAPSTRALGSNNMADKLQPDPSSIRIVKTRHDPRKKDETGKAPWDYSIYPDLTPVQHKAFEEIGATLYMIQMAEHAIKVAIQFILRETTDVTLDDLPGKDTSKTKRTLGQLLHEVRKTSQLHPQFDQILDGFLQKRNAFIHNMFTTAENDLESNEGIEHLNAFLQDLQDDAWSVQNVFLGCLNHWLKANGIWEHLPQSFRDNKHFAQLDRKGFEALVRTK